MKSIVVYYSRKGENYWSGGVRNIAKGNTERVAEYIAEATSADLFELETVKEYPADYYQCTDVAKRELQEHARPALKEIPDVSEYDTIYLGYPIWWGTMPMGVYTFLDAADLTDKTICPFATSEGSGLGSSEREVRRVAPSADVKPGFYVAGHAAEGSKAKASKWAEQYV